MSYIKVFSGTDPVLLFFSSFHAWKASLADLYLVPRVFSRVLLTDGNPISNLTGLWQGDCLQQQFSHLANSSTISSLSSFQTLGWRPSGPSDLFMSNLSTKLGTPYVLLTFWSVTSDLCNSNFLRFFLFSNPSCSSKSSCKNNSFHELCLILLTIISHFCHSNYMAKLSISVLLIKWHGQDMGSTAR